MAALTADQLITTKQVNGTNGIILDYQVAASTVIYEGGLVAINGAGYLVTYIAAGIGTTISGNRFVGIALEHIASQTSAGDARCKVLAEGMFEYALASAVIADVGKPVFASDDNTLTKVSLGNRYIGHVVQLVSAGNVLIRFSAMGSNSHPAIHRMSGILVVTVANNLALLIDATENHNGLLVTRALAIVTTTVAGSSEDQPVITLQDTAGTTLGITFTGTNTTPEAAGDIITAVGGFADVANAVTGDTEVIVPADLGVQAKVTQATAGTPAGAVKIYVEAVPIA